MSYRWMILDPKDPADQLQWLRDTLLLAETRREKVHILMHGPSVETDTLQVWNREYNRIIERFQSTIVGQFLGHTHRDQFYVYYSPRTYKPVSVAWNGGSVTPFTNVNPNYRIYTIHKQTLEVEDFDTYTYNLTEANQTPDSPPNWIKLYSFKQAYNIPSLKPYNIDQLVKKMSNDDELFNKFFLLVRFKFISSDTDKSMMDIVPRYENG
ncbi:hypothetical protein J6590_046664 [Homalodisca vitripennis]|nr:hypothetical protein J6590_046664 [Homalodisca vitripennis]